MKIGIGGLYHETHTFPKRKTTFSDFERTLYRGSEIIKTFSNTKTSIGGCLEYAHKNSMEIVPVFYSAATPSAMITKQTFEKLASIFKEDISRMGTVDGFLLAQHGAMCVEGYEDAEGFLIKMIRDTIGSIPLIVTTDYHANISENMVLYSDCIVGYDTYPHIDIAERGIDACRIMHKAVTEKIMIKNAFLSLPVLGAPQAITTETGVMKNAIDMAHDMEKEDMVLNVTVAGGFVYSDIKSAGISIIVSFDSRMQEGKAIDMAAEIGEHIWSERRKMAIKNTEVKDAISEAKNSTSFPVILVDVADNIGGGTSGDGTVLLQEMIKNKMSGSVVCICDKEAVNKCIKEGVGSNITIKTGGRSEDFHGEPVEVNGYIKLISDGEFINIGKNMTGLSTKMGKSVLLLLAEGIKVILTEFPTPPNDPNMLYSMGVDLKKEKYLVAKGAIAWKTGVDIEPAKIIYVDTPGLTSANLGNFNYKNIRRPVYPFDDFEINIRKSVKVYG